MRVSGRQTENVIPQYFGTRHQAAEPAATNVMDLRTIGKRRSQLMHSVAGGAVRCRHTFAGPDQIPTIKARAIRCGDGGHILIECPSVLHQLAGGVRAAMGYVGARDLADLREKAKFVRISSSSLRESHAHDVTITRESPNYPSGA